MPSVSLKPRCRVTDGPSCHDLLNNPEGVLADPDRWPRHVCVDVARYSTRRWAEARARSVYGRDVPGTVREWITTWPLPVSPPLISAPPVPTSLLPFPGPPFSATAALILDPVIPFAHVAVFGIIETVAGMTSRVGPLVTVAGLAPEPTDRITRFCAATDRWWNGVNATGRPRGSRHHRQDVIDAYLAYGDRMGRKPDQAELAAELEWSTRSLRDAIGPWGAFNRDAQAWRLARDAHAQHVAAMIEALASGKELP